MPGARQSVSAPAGPRLALLLLTLVFNAVLVWLATGLTTAAAGLLVVIVSAIEAVCWLRFLDRPEPQPVFNDKRFTALFSRSNTARQNAIKDEATGLFNRWYLDMRLEEEAARCKRYGYSMAVIVMRTGLVRLGDMSLDGWQEQSSEIGQKTLQVVRTVDLAACLAPFEFAICLVHCDRDGALRALERLETELSDFTVDSGISVYPDDNCEPRALVELARVRSRALSRAA